MTYEVITQSTPVLICTNEPLQDTRTSASTAKCTYVQLLHSGLGVCCSFEWVVIFFICLHGRWDYPSRKITYKNTPHQNGVRRHVEDFWLERLQAAQGHTLNPKASIECVTLYFPVAPKALCQLENKFSSQKVTGELKCSLVVQHVCSSMHKVLGSISLMKERRKKKGQKDEREGRKEGERSQACR